MAITGQGLAGVEHAGNAVPATFIDVPRRVTEAMPPRFCRKFSRVRSPVRMAAAGPFNQATACPGLHPGSVMDSRRLISHGVWSSSGKQHDRSRAVRPPHPLPGHRPGPRSCRSRLPRSRRWRHLRSPMSSARLWAHKGVRIQGLVGESCFPDYGHAVCSLPGTDSWPRPHWALRSSIRSRMRGGLLEFQTPWPPRVMAFCSMVHHFLGASSRGPECSSHGLSAALPAACVEPFLPRPPWWTA